MLEKLLKELKNKKGKENYRIPGKWLSDSTKKEIVVDPYDFISRKIEEIFEIGKEQNSYTRELSQMVFYSVLLRTTTAYPHSGKFEPVDKNGYKNTGTMLKTIAILPYLRKMGIDILYLLPISKYSDKYKKGEIGSPYAVKNFLELDPQLEDPLSELNVEEQFKCLVEAAHILGIKVIIDFIPRTAARDNDLILKHPEWFYWIKSEYERDFIPPKIPDLGFVQPDKDNLRIIYNESATKKHLEKFSFAPNIINREKWENFVKRNRNNPDFIEEIKREFGVITPPGFSDWVNDSQPLWSDVTFLRLYLSHPEESARYLKDNQPPYILFDVIKSSKFPGNEKNEELWRYLSNIIPDYQRKYRIDGARIDMGHALPKELEKSIINSARKIDPSFILIAEEFDMNNDKKALDNGYNLIIGNGWWSEPRIEEGEMEKFVFSILPKLSVPTFACSETPDTPRAIMRKHGKAFSRFSAVLNAFLPNAAEFINCGFEFYEKQPMNLGLDNDEKGRFVLDKEDPFYGKLAFFDYYCLHWNNDFEVYEILKYVNKIKKLNSDIISSRFLRNFETHNENILAIHYQNEEKGLIILINKNFDSSEALTLHFDVKRRLFDFNPGFKKVKGEIYLSPGEITILTYRIIENESLKFKVEYNYLKPHKKYYSDGGWDLRAKTDMLLEPGESKAIPTGIRCSIPYGYVGFIKPRSGLAIKHSIDTMAGVIDSEYRGEIKVILINHGKEPFRITKGDRIAQLVVVKVLLESEYVDTLEVTERNENGFGSTGRD